MYEAGTNHIFANAIKSSCIKGVLLKNVAILIINWKSSSLLLDCLKCIFRQKSIAADVIILDNGGEDPIPEDYLKRFSSVLFHKSEKNVGFAAGNNLLLRMAAGYKWIALVNPDTFLEPSWLNNMLSAAKNNPRYSFFASHLVRANNPSKIDGDGDAMHVSGLAWRKNYGLAANQGAINPTEVFSPCAAAALYRRDVLEEVGGFDEDFFCYFEDIDLGFRLRLAGHRCLFVPDAVAYHVGYASTGGQQSDFVVYHGHRNLVWNYVKNMPGILFWLFLPLHIIFNFVTVVWFSIKGRSRIIFKSKYDALLGITRMWKKRHEIQKNRQTSIIKILKILNKNILPRLSEKYWGCS